MGADFLFSSSASYDDYFNRGLRVFIFMGVAGLVLAPVVWEFLSFDVDWDMATTRTEVGKAPHVRVKSLSSRSSDQDNTATEQSAGIVNDWDVVSATTRTE